MPTSPRNVRFRLQDILHAIAGIQETVGGLGYETYVAVWAIKHACERGIEIISEASRHIPNHLKETEPAVPWHEIAGIGNLLRHGYESVSDRVIWDIIDNHLDPLDAAVRRLKERVEREEARD